MHNTLAILTQQNLDESEVGGRSRESQENSQLVLSLSRLAEPTGVTTKSGRDDAPVVELLQGQMRRGAILASRSFYDPRPIDEIANEAATTCDGSGGTYLASGFYRSVEFATRSRGALMSNYFQALETSGQT